jgi:hypothetical protein
MCWAIKYKLARLVVYVICFFDYLQIASFLLHVEVKRFLPRLGKDAKPP